MEKSHKANEFREYLCPRLNVVGFVTLSCQHVQDTELLCELYFKITRMIDSTLDINQKICGLCLGLPWFGLQVATCCPV